MVADKITKIISKTYNYRGSVSMNATAAEACMAHRPTGRPDSAAQVTCGHLCFGVPVLRRRKFAEWFDPTIVRGEDRQFLYDIMARNSKSGNSFRFADFPAYCYTCGSIKNNMASRWSVLEANLSTCGCTPGNTIQRH